MKKCAHPGCEKEGLYPAPRDPKNLSERQYFCLEHIKEFNKNWNGLAGMTQDDIWSMQTGATWDRHTWKFGTQNQSYDAATALFGRAEDLFSFFQQRLREDVAKGRSYHEKDTLPPDVQEACHLFEISEPLFDAKKLKQHYLSLMKKYHPDVNDNAKEAEEHVKKINVAYQILQDYQQKHLTHKGGYE